MTILRVRPMLLALAVVLVNCATLDPLPSGTCGNGVVDGSEDCDTFPSGQCGSPSEGAAQCRLKCGTNGAAPSCPDGWGCGVSGVCRQPTGLFDPASEPVSAGVTQMLVGDFDGDGRQDILGSSGSHSKGRIHYFNDVGAPDVVALPGVLASPFVYDFDGDGISDIAFGYTFRGASEIDEGTLQLDAASGYAIIVGQSDRQVVTKLFPTFTQPTFDALFVSLATLKAAELPATAVPGGANVAIATVLQKDGSPVTVLRSLGGNPADITQGLIKLLPGTLADVVGDPITAKIFDLAPRSTCGEIVVPLSVNGSAHVQVYSPCAKGIAQAVTWSNAEPTKDISLPGEPLKGTFVADIDGDGHLDLVVGTTLPSGVTKVRVYWGNGLDVALDSGPGAQDAPTDLTDVPLAAGFLDSDSLLDLVLPSGVLLTSRATLKDAGAEGGTIGVGAGEGGVLGIAHKDLTWNVVPAPTKSWTVAQIADVNRDGFPDVIGASRYEPDIDVMEGTKSLSMPSFSVPTTGSVTNLAVGDFDFDRTDDIAFVQAPASSVEREVAIAYGRPFTLPPETPRPAGRLDGIRQLFVSTTGVSITSIATPAGAPLASTSLAVLLASGDRQPVAPLLYSIGTTLDPAPPPSQRREIDTQVLVAAAQDKNVDLISLVSQTDFVRLGGKQVGPPSYSIWLSAGTGQAAFATPQQVKELPGLRAVDARTGLFLGQMVAGDLDGDGTAEVVALSPDTAGTGVELQIVRPGPGAASIAPALIPIPGRQAVGDAHAQLLDVDADGHLDLVAILRDATSQALQVNVFFGDGKGSLAVPGLTVALPIPTGARADDYASSGFTELTTAGAAIGASTGKRRELVVITTSHLFRLVMHADRTFDLSDATSLYGTIVDGTAVVAVDANGDGVQDLAIADNGSIRIAHQRPRLP